MRMAENGKKTSFEMILGAKDRFSGAFGKLKGAMSNAGADSKKLGRAWKGLETTAGCITRTMSTVGKGLGLVLGASGGLVSMAKRMGSLAMEADNTASRAGLNLKTWQEYAYAAERAGVSASSLEGALGSLGDKSKEIAKEGDKDGLFKKIGLDPKTAEGKAHASTVILSKLADKIKALKEAGEDAKAADLARAFGVCDAQASLTSPHKGAGWHRFAVFDGRALKVGSFLKLAKLAFVFVYNGLQFVCHTSLAQSGLPTWILLPDSLVEFFIIFAEFASTYIPVPASIEVFRYLGDDLA